MAINDKPRKAALADRILMSDFLLRPVPNEEALGDSERAR
jgi:hypothetical protein